MDEKLYFTVTKGGDKIVTVSVIDTDGDVYLYKMSKNSAKAIEWYVETFALEQVIKILDEEEIEELDF